MEKVDKEFEKIRTIFELKYDIKPYKVVSDLIDKNNQPCVQTEWRKTPFPTRYYEEINKYELCSGMTPPENNLTLKKLQSSLYIIII